MSVSFAITLVFITANRDVACCGLARPLSENDSELQGFFKLVALKASALQQIRTRLSNRREIDKTATAADAKEVINMSS